jgi:3-hydroxyisobutyrate dehydrogenase-like beta-hydroxyacid dehydrogenase
MHSQGNDRPVTVAVLGLGEAGMAIATDLVAAGATVRAYDPAVATPPSMFAGRDEADAADGADVVLSVNSASAALGALRSGLRAPVALWADLNTSAAALKRDLADACGPVPFADVALMSPVAGRGLATPSLVAGSGAARYAELLNPMGAQATVLDGPAGLAATRKLLRSVFYKGLAAAVLESLTAARAAGHEDWIREHIAGELAAFDAATLPRLEEGSVRHAVRRAEEMAAAVSLLGELGTPSMVSAAARDWLRELSTVDRP